MSLQSNILVYDFVSSQFLVKIFSKGVNSDDRTCDVTSYNQTKICQTPASSHIDIVTTKTYFFY